MTLANAIADTRSSEARVRLRDDPLGMGQTRNIENKEPLNH
ncbi:MAG TPA: hypothetical protein VER12_08865 [Polyangiaceae bacterium]|nr:hypothetical protein [Polyangiaceae bacterium]